MRPPRLDVLCNFISSSLIRACFTLPLLPTQAQCGELFVVLCVGRFPLETRGSNLLPSGKDCFDFVTRAPQNEHWQWLQQRYGDQTSVQPAMATQNSLWRSSAPPPPSNPLARRLVKYLCFRVDHVSSHRKLGWGEGVKLRKSTTSITLNTHTIHWALRHQVLKKKKKNKKRFSAEAA